VSRGEIGLRFGAGVVPADVSGDGGVLFVVTAMVGAVEREVTQGRELGLDPVQPGAVGRQEDQLDVVVDRPGADVCVFVRGEVVQHHIQLLPGPTGAQPLEEVEELPPALARADAVVQLAGGQIEGGEHVPHAARAVVGGPQPARTPHRPPRFALAGHQVQRPELIDAYHPPVSGRSVVQRQDAVHLGDELRVGGRLPGSGGLPGDLALAQDPAQGLPADGRGHLVLDEVVGELAQAPGGERGDLPVSGGGPGDQRCARAPHH
jgi:hypothetical protein